MLPSSEHDIVLKARKTIEVTGVSNVESFDVNEFVLTTTVGPLYIKGSNLHMKHLDLDSGHVHIEGTVTSMAYVADKAKKQRLVGRLFR